MEATCSSCASAQEADDKNIQIDEISRDVAAYMRKRSINRPDLRVTLLWSMVVQINKKRYFK